MARLSIRIDFEPTGSALGPGMAALLDRVGRLGSIRKAAADMGMSYRKAWLLLQGMHQTFGSPVVATETGGSRGGGARLTELGMRLLETYRVIEANAARAAAAEMQALSALVQENAKPRNKSRSKSASR